MRVLLRFVALVSLSLIAGVSTLALAQGGREYLTTFTDENGTSKDLCLTFNEDGTLEIELIQGALTWTRQKLGRKKNSFMAVTVNPVEFGVNLMFFGKATKKKLKGEGMNEAGISFKLVGVAVNCRAATPRREPGPFEF